MKLRIMHIEDNPRDSELIRETIEREGMSCEILRLDTRDALIAALDAGSPDIVLCDYKMPSYDGISALREIRRRNLQIPFIFVSGTIGEARAVEALKLGATDYVLKNELARLAPSIRRAMREAEETSRRRSAEESLRSSEESYRSLFENNPHPMWFFDVETLRFLDVNEAAIRRYGYDRKEFLSMTIKDIRPAEQVQRLLDDIQQEHKGLDVAGQWKHRKKDGTIVDVEITSHEIGYAGRKAKVVLANDITETKRAEENLKLQTSYFRQLFESSPAAIVILDAGDRVVDINPSFTKIFQYTHEEIKGRLLDDHIFPDEKLSEATQFHMKLLEGKIVESETVRKRKDGKMIDVSLTGYPIIIEGKRVGVYGIYVDIADRKRLEEQLRQAQKLESIGTLAGGIAHDFNNILGIIIAYGTLLQRGKVSPKELPEYLDAMMKAADRGSGLVRQILTFARKSVASVESVQVNNVIKELVSMLYQMFPKTIKFSVELDNSLPVISIDSGQLNQALMNLCVNARDAILDAKRTSNEQSTITIRTARVLGKDLDRRFETTFSDEYISVSVSDNGTGMDEKTRQRIFEPFFTTKEQGRGTGLGLAVVYGVVQSYHGYVDLESELGKGTTFTLYFPVPKSVSPESGTADKPLEVALGGSETILVIEDEEALRMLLKNLLQAKGYTVLSASDGLEGVEVFERNKDRVSLVISDIGLPGLNGSEAVKRMMKTAPGLKCVIASGYMEPDQKSDVLKSGVKEFIVKPYDPLEVLRRVREVLDLK